MKSVILLCLSLLFISVTSNGGFGPGKQDYGYVTVRDKAHMFWWLFHTTANVSDTSERPLIMWLQGGPGVSSCGYGNFLILGPLDSDLKPRNHTWVKDFNVLFVDNPVGTGYSYVEDKSLLTHNTSEIARDLVTLIKSFFEKLPQFKKTPFYVYGQSYGGKMAVGFAKLLHEEVVAGKIQSNIRGVAMGNAWISPIDSTLSYASFVYNAGLVDKEGKNDISKQTENMQKVCDEGNIEECFLIFRKTLSAIQNHTDGVDLYNILNKRSKNQYLLNEFIFNEPYDDADRLKTLMNGKVKDALNIPKNVTWSYSNRDVYFALSRDIMNSVTGIVESLLNNTNMKVHVYNGNLDLIVDTPGQLMWVDKLRWHDRDAYVSAPRKAIRVNNLREGYEKTGGKFSFFWINVAAHAAPRDNPAGIRWMLKSMTGV